MISFYPGPSKLYKTIPVYMQEACSKGVLSINHRSPEFVEISKNTIALLKQKLLVPEDYTVFFVSSATECWEIIAQSLIKNGSYHLYNGAFGEKWFEYTKKLHPKAEGQLFGLEEELIVETNSFSQSSELIAITQNETSNGTEVSSKVISNLRNKFPQKLIAVDATSSMAGIYLDFTQADIWFASVQKCFGLPAGMAVMICSPNAINRTTELMENKHYNSLISMLERMKEFQTTHTPNVLSIYLLMKVLEEIPSIKKIDRETSEKAKDWYDFFMDVKGMELLVKNPYYRSKTVISVKAKEELIQKIKKEAKEEGLLLGNGYGQWKSDTFRIANFPAIEESDINKLKDFITRFSIKF